MTPESYQPIVIPDESKGYPPIAFCIPNHYEDSIESILVPSGMVQDRLEKLARDIVIDLGKGPLVVVCVLKGGYKFFADLLDKVKQYIRYVGEDTTPIGVDFIRLKSYKDGESSGNIEVIGGDSLLNLKGKNVLVVEDMIDTGRTMVKLLDLFRQYEPVVVKVACLLVKRTDSVYRPDYCGFEVPNKYIVGYAIDYNEYFRDLNHVCTINDHGKKKFSSKSTKQCDDANRFD